MNEQMKRFESRIIEVGDFKVKFSWFSKSSKLIKGVVLKEVNGLFGKRYKEVYYDTFEDWHVLNYYYKAEELVDRYLYENFKWKNVKA